MKKRLVAIMIALVIGAGSLFALFSYASGSLDDAIAERPCWKYPNMNWYTDFETIELALQQRVEQGDNPRLLFGSSEFNTVNDGFTNVRNLFTETNYGFDPMCIGQGHIMSLWHAIEVGALDDQIPDGKVVLMTSINWFMSYQNYEEFYPSCFSKGAYRTLMENPDISDETKEYVRTKLVKYGISEKNLSKGMGLSNLDDAISELSNRTRRACIMRFSKQGTGKNPWIAIPESVSQEVQAPDWDDIYDRAYAQALEMSTTSEFGFNDKYTQKEVEEYYKSLSTQGKVSDEYWNENEFDDFAMFLQICKECDIEPLIIIQPVPGYIYDHSKWTADVRAEYFEKIIDICNEYGVEYVDGSPYEYEKYYFKDVAHPGWLLWTVYDKAIYDFFMK